MGTGACRRRGRRTVRPDARPKTCHQLPLSPRNTPRDRASITAGPRADVRTETTGARGATSRRWDRRRDGRPERSRRESGRRRRGDRDGDRADERRRDLLRPARGWSAGRLRPRHGHERDPVADPAGGPREEFTTVAYDVRGHGHTGGSDRAAYDVELYAADLHALLDALDLEDPVLCGPSMGAASRRSTPPPARRRSPASSSPIRSPRRRSR